MSVTINDTLARNHAGGMARLLVGFVFALAVTLSLFWLMQYLIATADRSLNDDGAGNLVDFVRVKRDESIQRRQLKPKKPPPPEAPPEQPPSPKLDNLNPNAEKIAISAVPVETDSEMTGGFSLGVGEGDYLPIVKVAPIYPNRALTRGIEGFCVVQYTVTRLGTTINPVVLEDKCTSTLFHRASLNAALKFKYKPRVVDGVPVEVSGVKTRITFELESYSRPIALGGESIHEDIFCMNTKYRSPLKLCMLLLAGMLACGNAAAQGSGQADKKDKTKKINKTVANPPVYSEIENDIGN